MLKPLTLHLKREYWEAIRDGSKLEEYRKRGPYWDRRILKRKFSEVRLLLGYPPAGDTARLLRRHWCGVSTTVIRHPQFGGYCDVFAIDVSTPYEDLPRCLCCAITFTLDGTPQDSGQGMAPRLHRWSRRSSWQVVCPDCWVNTTGLTPAAAVDAWRRFQAAKASNDQPAFELDPPF